MLVRIAPPIVKFHNIKFDMNVNIVLDFVFIQLIFLICIQMSKHTCSRRN